jgi:DNA-binding MarR family transcriptional regulator
MSVADLQAMIMAGLVRPVRRTADGRITEYELTHAGRVLAERLGMIDHGVCASPLAGMLP